MNRHKWVSNRIAPDSPDAVTTVADMRKFLEDHPNLPDDAVIQEDNPCCGGPLVVEYRRPWTAEEHEAEAARLRQIEEDEREDREAGF